MGIFEITALYYYYFNCWYRSLPTDNKGSNWLTTDGIGNQQTDFKGTYLSFIILNSKMGQHGGAAISAVVLQQEDMQERWVGNSEL